MQRVKRIGAMFVVALLLPAAVFAQAAISGVVRDASGAVLPGVTVEAASPALIEKVRVTVSDGSGQYAIENLRPGQYTVTFTLPGFATVRREGIVLSGSFNARINAELRVGGLEETITVTGETPVVDLQSTQQQRVMDREILDTLPSSGLRNALGVLIPSVDFRRQDVGGAGTSAVTGNMTAHGARSEDAGTTLNGISIASFGTSASTATIFLNPMGLEEIQIDTGSNDAELHAGGVRTNYVLREGGNAFHGVVFGAYAPGGLQSDNLTDDLIARGLETPAAIKANWDINPAIGGPILRDKVWFFFAARYNVSAEYAPGLFANRNLNDFSEWTYDPDPSRLVYNESRQPDTQLRLTWQADDRNKIGFTWYDTSYCFCPTDADSVTAEEAAGQRDYPLQRLIAGDWTMPATNRLLFEVRGQLYKSESDDVPWGVLSQAPNGLGLGPVPAQDRSTRMRYRARDDYRWLTQSVHNWAGSMSYITGAHALKFGFNQKWGGSHYVDFDLQPVSYRIRNGIAGDGTPAPDRITLRAYALPGPEGRDSQRSGWRGDVDADLGLFLQDRWTSDRLTLNLGLRYDYFHNSYPEQRIGPATLAPNRDITFPAQDGWGLHDLSPRVGAVYDLFGTGRTALKASVNRYVLAMGPDVDFIRLANPSRNLVLSTTRNWSDSNGNFIPDCDLTDPSRNGECSAMADENFGTSVSNVTFDEDTLTGFGKRNYNWEISAGVQHELMPNVSLDVSYFRRWYGNFVMTNDLAVGPEDYDRYSLTAPTHPDLPGGGGYVLDDLYNIKPEKFGTPADPLVTLASQYGDVTDRWDGADFVLNARPRPGMFFQGGVSTGRRVEDVCDVVTSTGRGEMAWFAWDTPSSLHCRRVEPLSTRFKGYGAYTIPAPVDVQIAATYQDRSGAEVVAEYTATNAEVRESLGRDLSGGARDVDVHLLSPGRFGRFFNQTQGEVTGERLRQVDLRVSKLLNFGGSLRARLNLDIYNAFNASTILRYQSTFDEFLDPREILVARFFKFSMQFDF